MFSRRSYGATSQRNPGETLPTTLHQAEGRELRNFVESISFERVQESGFAGDFIEGYGHDFPLVLEVAGSLRYLFHWQQPCSFTLLAAAFSFMI